MTQILYEKEAGVVAEKRDIGLLETKCIAKKLIKMFIVEDIRKKKLSK